MGVLSVFEVRAAVYVVVGVLSVVLTVRRLLRGRR